MCLLLFGYMGYWLLIYVGLYMWPQIVEVWKGKDTNVYDFNNVHLVIQCVFFMRTKVNANFTYLYLIEINDWCLIFSSMLGHLIIYKEIQILIIMLLVKLENLKLVGFQFCRVETRIYCYTKLSIFCFVLFQHYKIMSWRTNLRKDCFLNLSKY